MPLTPEEIHGLALLSRLALTPEEETSVAQDLEKILGYVGRLASIHTSHISETAREMDQQPAADEPCPMDLETREQIVTQFPDRVADILRVPGVFSKRGSAPSL